MQGKIDIEDRLTDGIRCVLPQRNLTKLCHWGWAICGVAACGILFMGAWMTVPIVAGLGIVRDVPVMGMAAMAFAALGLGGLLPMLKLFALGWAVLRNATYADVRLKDGMLICCERFYGFKYTRRCPTPIDELRTLSLQRPPRSSTSTGLSSLESSLGPYAHMLVTRWGADKKEQFTITAVYPRDVLQELMEVLHRHLRQATIVAPAEVGTESELLPGEEPSMSWEVADAAEDIEQPPRSDVSVERTDEGVTLYVPPAGVLRGSKGLLVFAIIWNGLIGLFAAVWTLAAWGVMDAPSLAPWLGYLLLLPFLAIGIGLLIGAINMGTRATAIAASDHQLTVARLGLFGQQTRRWGPNETFRIQVANSGMAVNHQPVKELQIHGPDGKVGILSERPEMELRWIAAELARGARLKASSTATMVPDRIAVEPTRTSVKS